MNKWLIAGLMAWPPVFFFGLKTFKKDGAAVVETQSDEVKPGSVVTARDAKCVDNKLPNGMPCPTEKAANDRDARTISNIASDTPLTIYADRDGTVPAIIIGLDGVVHFPKGANADTFQSAGGLVIENGVWKGDITNLKGDSAEPCTATATDTGVKISCGAGGEAEVKNGTPAQSPGACSASKTGTRTTISCPGSSPVTIDDGASATSCASDPTCLEAVTREVRTRARLSELEAERNQVISYIGYESAISQSACGGTDITEFLKYWYEVDTTRESLTQFAKCFDCRTQSIVDRVCRVPRPL